MSKARQITLTEVFGDLTARLDQLEFYHETIRADFPPLLNYSMIDEIGSQIYKYPTKDVLKIVEKAITRVTQLISKGEAIVTGVAIEVEDEIYDGTKVAPVQTTKKAKGQLYESIRMQLMLFQKKLLIMKESLLLNQSVSDTGIKKGRDFTIPTDELSLDEFQCALLFNYLRERKVIQPLTNTALAGYVSLLTGHSAKQIRAKKGFSSIEKIMADQLVNKTKKGETVSYNLKTVKQVLQNVLAEVDREIKRRQRN